MTTIKTSSTAAARATNRVFMLVTVLKWPFIEAAILTSHHHKTLRFGIIDAVVKQAGAVGLFRVIESLLICPIHQATLIPPRQIIIPVIPKPEVLVNAC